MRIAVLSIVLGFGAAVLTGCVPKADQPSGAASGTVEIGGDWPFWPSKMRFHPLTRILSSNNGAGLLVIEARVEFSDAHGDTTKAAGQMTISLSDAEAPGSQPFEDPTWNQDLRNLEVNDRQWDDVTQTYLFRLEISDQDLPRAPELHAYFLSANGAKLEADAKVNR